MAEQNAGERAVSGTADDDAGNSAMMALAGAAAGAFGVWALDRVDWFLWNHEDERSRARTTAVRPGGEPPAQALVTKVEGATGNRLSAEAHETTAQVVHYSIGIAPAVGYALVRDKIPVQGVGRGALYGVGLFLMQDEVMNTVTGLGNKPQLYPWQAHARGLVAHIVYGVATEIALGLLVDVVRKGVPARA